MITDFCSFDEDAKMIIATHQKGFMTVINTDTMELVVRAPCGMIDNIWQVV